MGLLLLIQCRQRISNDLGIRHQFLDLFSQSSCLKISSRHAVKSQESDDVRQNADARIVKAFNMVCCAEPIDGPEIQQRNNIASHPKSFKVCNEFLQSVVHYLQSNNRRSIGWAVNADNHRLVQLDLVTKTVVVAHQTTFEVIDKQVGVRGSGSVALYASQSPSVSLAFIKVWV